MSHIMKIIHDLIQKAGSLFTMYYEIIDNNNSLDVYFKCRLFRTNKKLYSIPFVMVDAIYAENGEYNHFILKFFTSDRRRLYFRKPHFKNDNLSLKNWDELKDTLAKKYSNFNWNNFNLVDELWWDTPILCWHAKKSVPDLKLITVQESIQIVYKNDEQEYMFDEYLDLIKESKTMNWFG